KLQGQIFRRAVIQHFGPHAEAARAQATMERAEGLPLEPIDGKPRRMPLADGISSELPAPALVVALGASEVELALPCGEELSAVLEMASRRAIDRNGNGHSPRLIGDKRGEPQQIVRLVRERLRALPLTAALVDTQLEVQQFARGLIDHGITCCHAPHADMRIAMAAGARFAFSAR